MITKHKLVLDTAELLDSDNVGAYIRSSDGTLITHTNVGGKDALDVNVANEVTVNATDLDIRNLAFATDKVDVSGSSVSITGDVNVTQGTSPWVVSATDLDIRNLSYTQDSIQIKDNDGDALAINPDGSLNVSANVTSNTEYAEDSAHTSGDKGNFILAVRNDADASLVSADGDYAPLQVDDLGRLKVAADISVVNGFEKAEDSAHSSGDIGGYILSVRQDVLSASASADGDYQSFKTDALGRLYANNSHQSMANSAISVTNTATDLVASDLSNRKRILVQNRGSKPIFLGKDNTVTTSNGMELPSGASIELDIGAGVNLHAITASGSADVRIMELA